MDGQTTHRLEHHQTRHATNHTEPGNQVPRAAREINDRLNPNSWKLCPLPLSNLQSNCANRLPHWFPPVPKQAEWISGCPIDRSYLLSAPSRWQYWQERRAEWLARLLRTDRTGLRVFGAHWQVSPRLAGGHVQLVRLRRWTAVPLHNTFLSPVQHVHAFIELKTTEFIWVC